jgi:GrpB-like predicted nucleotidyltransferase (UPF0157 family)
LTKLTDTSADAIEIRDYDSAWPELYAAQRDLICTATGDAFVEFEHIGSTAVPGLSAKPIIDMMVAVRNLGDTGGLLEKLGVLGYRVKETGMRNRVFLRKRNPNGQVFHLHIVELATWDDRKERHLRDYLIENPDAAKAYGALKVRLAEEFRDDALGYTKAKTGFVQQAIDRVRDAKGLPRVDVWEE